MSPAVVCVPLHWCQRAGVVLSHAQKKTFRWIALASTIFVDLYVLSSVKKKKNSMWPQAPPSSYSTTSHWTRVHHKPLPLSCELWYFVNNNRAFKKAEAFLRSFWIGRWALISYRSRLLRHKYDIPGKFKTLWSLCVMLICHSQVHRSWSIFAEH